MTIERWLPISGYESQYEISNWGRVKSLERTCKSRWKTPRHVKGRMMRQNETKQGYKYILLCQNGKKAKFFIHRLVAMAFIYNPKNHPQVNHIDGDKAYNFACNLEWVTAQQNCHHALENKLYITAIGVDAGNAKLTEDAVRDIRRQAENGIYHRTLAEQYGVGRKAITKIVNRQRWKHIV
jgi:hypothetical protein